MSISKVKLDKDLFERCKQHAQQIGYSSVEEFISHILEKEVRNKQDNSAETKEIKKQLKGLGYIG